MPDITMTEIAPVLLVVAIVVFHIHTCFTEATHLNRWQPWLIIFLMVIFGTLPIYFVSRNALFKLCIQLLLIALFFIIWLCFFVIVDCSRPNETFLFQNVAEFFSSVYFFCFWCCTYCQPCQKVSKLTIQSEFCPLLDLRKKGRLKTKICFQTTFLL